MLTTTLVRADAARITEARITDTEFLSTDGEAVSLSDYRGSVVLLHFLASWCGECLLEAPSLAGLSKALAGEDFKIVAVAIDDTPADAKRLADRLSLPFPVLIDSAGALKRSFGAQGLPMTVALDRAGDQTSFEDPSSGKQVSRVIGRRDWLSPAALTSIRKLLATEPETADSRAMSTQRVATSSIKSLMVSARSSKASWLLTNACI